MFRLGVVSFLNSRPLIDGLASLGDVELRFDVPARLPALLDSGDVDAALLPVVDILRRPGEYSVISDACIGCDGETMTVRVFSHLPPDRIRRLRVDGDSHTSVALAQVLWRESYERELTIEPLSATRSPGDDGSDADLEAVLLIGDKVVSPRRGSFAYEVDLGGAWRQHTGLPFVFAVWAARVPSEPRAAARVAAAGVSPAEVAPQTQSLSLTATAQEQWHNAPLAAMLSAARDRGVAHAAEIAAVEGPRHGWPVEPAVRYLTRCMKYRLDARLLAGAELFARLCVDARLAPRGAAPPWAAVARDEPAGAAP